MEDSVRDNRMRMAAFERVRALCESHGHLTAQQLGEGFYVDGQRYPLINPRRGIFKPAQCDFCCQSTQFSRKRVIACGTTISVRFTVRFSTATRWWTTPSWARIQTPQTIAGLRKPSRTKFRSFIFWGSRRDDIRPSFRPSSEVGIGHHGELRSASASLNKGASRRPRRTLNADTH
jgi:hypothetical protein